MQRSIDFNRAASQQRKDLPSNTPFLMGVSHNSQQAYSSLAIQSFAIDKIGINLTIIRFLVGLGKVLVLSVTSFFISYLLSSVETAQAAWICLACPHCCVKRVALLFISTCVALESCRSKKHFIHNLSQGRNKRPWRGLILNTFVFWCKNNRKLLISGIATC